VDYLPAESNTGMFGGNSNWRGPIWMPVNVLIIRALLNFYLYYGDNFRIECPTGSGKLMNLFDVSKEIADRLTRIFLRDERGRRPVYGGTEKFQSDPHWRDHVLFYEYFHGDNGASGPWKSVVRRRSVTKHGPQRSRGAVRRNAMVTVLANSRRGEGQRRELRHTDNYGWRRGRIGRSMNNDEVAGRRQWNIAGDIEL
jgi:hypothetical protein